MWIRLAIGVVLLLVGGVWIGQGVGWIHGSFMTGEAVWAVIGVATLAVGAWLVSGATRTAWTAERRCRTSATPLTAPYAVIGCRRTRARRPGAHGA